MKDENIQPHFWGITASGMKLIALTAMFLDHFAVVYLSDFMLKGDWTQLSVRSDYLSSHEGSMLAIAYSVLRLVGRISFPIYAYLIAEGLSYTSNRMKYSLRLFIFALLSEIPFDIAFHKQWFDFGSQNVFWTLFIGLLVICVIDYFEQDKKTEHYILLRECILLLVTASGAILAKAFHTDYGMKGVIAIVLIYLIKMGSRKRACAYALSAFAAEIFYRFLSNQRSDEIWISLCLVLLIFIACNIPFVNVSAVLCACLFIASLNFSGIYSILAVVPVFFYNSRKGRGWKWFFYVCYPLHLILLSLLRMVAGYEVFFPA